MRSSSHILAASLAKKLSGTPFASSFYEKVISRPDDMTEIVSYYLANYGKSIPNAMRKGFKKVLESLSTYQIAKYKGSSHSLKLVDLVNLFHPKSENFKGLVEGTLKNTQTWEAKLSSKGSTEEGKQEVWEDMVNDNLIGFLALIRNLRNILNSNPTSETIDKVCELLVNEDKINKSKVFPFQIAVAYEETVKINDSNSRKVAQALSKAIDISCKSPSMTEIKGDTCVMLDQSGSMGGEPIRIGSLFAGVLAKAYNADIVCFGSNARDYNYALDDSTMRIATDLNNANLGGTNFEAPISHINGRKYDRVIILSDMQSWGQNYGSGDTNKVWKKYKADNSPEAILYSFDLQSYGTLQFPESKVITLA